MLEGCRNNNRKIQKLVYDRYCDAMFTISYRIIGDYDIANDALQEAFIQVFGDIKQFRGEASLGAWIKTIVIRSSYRKLKKEDAFSRQQFDQNGDNITWPEEMKGEDLEKAILSISSGSRAVFLLVEVEGYKHREVAEMLNISEGTSKSQLNYAKKQLQEILKDFVE